MPFDLEAGQVVSIVVQGSSGLTPQIVLETPDLQTTTATAAGPNGAAVLQAVPTALTGTYKIRVTGTGGTFGSYSVRVVLNATLEAEAHGGPNNDTLLSAQNLDNSFIALGIGIAERGAVVGTGSDGIADFYKFSLAPNQTASLALSSPTSGGATLELRDASGNLLAAGSNSANFTRTINNFVTVTGGAYYVSVVGATSEYSLLVTRNADVDAEPNNDLGPGAQDATLSGTALGAVVNGVVIPSGGGTPVSGPIDVIGSPLSLGFAVDGSFVGSNVGAIHNGVEYIRHGTFLGTYTVAFNGATYTNAAPSNPSAFAVLLEDLSSGSQHVIRATGSIIPNVRFERIVSWKDGDDHAVIFTKITNNTGAPLSNVAVLENVDPDPGGNYDTLNDVTAAGRLVVGANGSGAMALGSTDPRAVVSAEDFFVTDPFAVINSPVDPNNASADAAINLAFNLGTLPPGATEEMAAVMIFGATKTAVEATYANVASTTTTGDVDSYSFQANAGDLLTLATNRPAVGPGEFVNNLDLAIELYDPLGNLVASDPAGALTHLAALSGSYTVRVLAENNSEGEYVLNVSGHTGALAPFEVMTSSPADGDHVLVAPAEITLDFSDSILLSSVDAADLSVNGVAATNVVVVDGNTLRFTLPPAVEGTNNVVLAGGALTDLQGQPLEPFSIAYDLDLTAPRVIASSLLEGDSISSGSLVYTAQFDDPLLAAFLDASDVQLQGQFSGSHAPTFFSYDPVTLTLTVEYSGLSEDLYALTLLSGLGSFADQFGRGLDGEPAAVGTIPSGDGVEGGNFVVHFGYDDSTPRPWSGPLTPVQPLGSAVYEGQVNDTIEFHADQDRFSLSLEKNQTISIAVRGSGGLVPRVSLMTPGSPLAATAVAGGPNGAAVLQSIPTTAAGNYIILVEGAAGTTGNYEITVVLNAGLEQENFDGSDNGLQIDAQDLNPAFQDRGTIGAAVAAVVGRGDPLSGPVYSDSQTQYGIVSQPNVLTYNFASASASASIGDAVLTVTAYADLDSLAEYLRLEAEGIFLQDLFVTGGSQSTQVTTQLTIPLATLAQLATDGTISFTVTPSISVGSLPSNFLTFSLEYPTGSSVGGDWYEFSLEDGESASLAINAPNGIVLEMFDAAGALVATGVETDNLTQAIANFADQTSDGVAETYYVRVTVGTGPYNLVVTRNSDFDAEPNQDVSGAQDIGGVSGVSGHIIASPPGSTPLEGDWYQFGVNAGDILRIQTSTPGGGVGEPANLLDPSIELIDPSGNVVASGNQVGNELLFHVALAAGQYRVRVSSETTSGEYFLQVEGATGSSLPPAVVDADPDVNSRLNAFPLTYTLTLSEATLPSSLQASDLLIGGLPAIALNVIDARTLEFTVDPNVNLGSGVYQVELAAGAVQDLQGAGNIDFNASFEVDVTPPVIIDTFWNGSPLKVSRLYNEGALTFQALFSEDLLSGALIPGTKDVFVTNAQTGINVYPLTVSYDSATDRLTAEFGTLSEGDYTLTVLSGNGSVEDLVGNDLDGDPLGAGLDGTTTGNGVAGGNYTATFSVDRTSPASLNPFVAVEPLGGLIASSQNNAGFINTAGDQEVFEHVFEAGQSLSVILRPANPLATLTVQLIGVTSIYAAAAPGQAVVLPLTTLTASGLYELRVSGDVKGAFSLDVVINAAIEPGSDSADGQELAIDDSLVDLGSGRYAVLGRSTATPLMGTIVANGSFETGNFGGWITSITPRGASPLRNWTVSTAGNGLNGFGLVPTAPQDGNFVAWNGFDGSALMEYMMYQNVTLPAGPGPLLLSWQDRVQWNFTAGSPPALQPRLYEVQIRNPATNAVLATLHSFSTDVETVNPTGDTGWQTRSADLGAFAGQTVRLYFVEKIPESSTGPGQLEIDNVSISALDPGGPDTDEYTLDLSGKAGSQLDVVLAGLDGADFSGQLLELLDDAGNVLAAASASPLGPGVNATNFDLGITNFVVPDIGSNVFTLRLHSAVPGKYSLVVTEDLIFDTEPNQDHAGPLRDIDQTGALGYLSAETSPAAGQIEPDDYSFGTALNAIVPGVTLSVTSSPSMVVTAVTSPYAPTGSLVFSASGTTGWSSSRRLQASFAVPANQVSITVGSDDTSDTSFLSAYDVSGNLLATVNSAALSQGQTQVLTITRGAMDIAYVQAGGVSGDVVFLDRLQFNGTNVSNTGDAYQLSLLAGQSVTIFTETPMDGAQDLPGNALDPKLTLLDSAGQVLIVDANARDGKNAELTFTATVAGTYVVRVGQEAGDGAYLLRAVKGAAGADFDRDGAVDGNDFLAWQRGFGIVAPNAVKADGDANDDAKVDGDDLAVWKAQYGNVQSPVTAFAASVSAGAQAESLANSVAEDPSVVYRAAIDAAMAMSLMSDISDFAETTIESDSLTETSEGDDVELALDAALPQRWSAFKVDNAFDYSDEENDAQDADHQWLFEELLDQVFGEQG